MEVYSLAVPIHPARSAGLAHSSLALSLSLSSQPEEEEEEVLLGCCYMQFLRTAAQHSLSSQRLKSSIPVTTLDRKEPLSLAGTTLPRLWSVLTQQAHGMASN